MAAIKPIPLDKLDQKKLKTRLKIVNLKHFQNLIQVYRMQNERKKIIASKWNFA